MPAAKASARELQIFDPVLTNLARRYTPDGFIYSQLAPTINVELDSGQYPVFSTAEWFGDYDDNKVSDRAVTPEVDFSWSTDTYLCEDYRLKASITAKERRQANSALRLEQSKLELVLMRMAIRKEVRLAAALRATGNGGQLTGGTAVPSNKWNVDAATIEADIKTGKMAVYSKTGKVPNTIVLPYLVAAEVAVQKTIRDLMKYTVNANQILSTGEFILPSTLWGMKVVIPTGAMVNSNRDGNATASLGEIWSDSVRLLYVAPSGGGWGIPSVAYSFKSKPQDVDRWEEKDPPVEFVRAWECVTEKVVAPDAGYEINDVL